MKTTGIITLRLKVLSCVYATFQCLTSRTVPIFAKLCYFQMARANSWTGGRWVQLYCKVQGISPYLPYHFHWRISQATTTFKVGVSFQATIDGILQESMDTIQAETNLAVKKVSRKWSRRLLKRLSHGNFVRRFCWLTIGGGRSSLIRSSILRSTTLL